MLKDKTSQWLMEQVKNNNSWFFTIIFLGLGQCILTILFSGLIAYIIYAAFILKYSLSTLVYPFVLLIISILGRSLVLTFKEIASFKVSAAVRLAVRKKIIFHINSLGPIKRQAINTGELITTTFEQIESLNDFYAYYLPQKYLAAIVPLLILSVIFYFSWFSGLILLFCGPLIPLFMALVGMGAVAANQRHFEALARMSSHFLDVLQGLTTLKLFNRSKQQLITVENISDGYRKTTMKILRLAFMSSGVLEFFSSVSIALVALMLGLSLLQYIHFGYYGHLSLFSALFILLMAPEFFLPLRELGIRYHAKAEAVSAAKNILSVLDIKVLEKEEKKVESLFSDVLTVEFDQVAFSYNQTEKKLLSNISFSVMPGKPLYIIGVSGEGKTTILNLLMGLLQPISGRIKINDSSLQNISQSSWLKKIAWLGQTPKLFYGTIRENLLLAKNNASEQEIKEALQLAKIYDFVFTLPDGLDTMLDEQATTLSGGQIQRIALARAFLKKAPVLLLDEPTACLDEENEKEVLSSIEDFSKNRTVIMLTHRLNTIPADAQVLLLSNGKLRKPDLFNNWLRCDAEFEKTSLIETLEIK